MERIPEENEILSQKEAKLLHSNVFLVKDCIIIRWFRSLCYNFHKYSRGGHAIDIGSGSGAMSLFFAFEYSDLKILAIDGSLHAVSYGRLLAKYFRVQNQIEFKRLHLPAAISTNKPDLIFSRSTLHHFKDPLDFWETIKLHSDDNTAIFILVLRRPDTIEELEPLKNGLTPELKDLRVRSYMAAYTMDEVMEQIKKVGLKNLKLTNFGNFQFIIYRDCYKIYN